VGLRASHCGAFFSLPKAGPFGGPLFLWSGRSRAASWATAEYSLGRGQLEREHTGRQRSRGRRSTFNGWRKNLATRHYVAAAAAVDLCFGRDGRHGLSNDATLLRGSVWGDDIIFISSAVTDPFAVEGRIYRRGPIRMNPCLASLLSAP
jgi:hypothetical protein